MRDGSSRLAQDKPEGDDTPHVAQVLQFRPRQHAAEPSRSVQAPELPDDDILPDGLAAYEQDRDDEPVNYTQRMLMNVIAIAVVCLLIGVGVWLADTIAEMERDQDCVLQGRQNCAPIEVPAPPPAK
jgi:hypothetical protein